MAPSHDFVRRRRHVRTAIEAYQAAAWRAPAATRFDSRPANDVAGDAARPGLAGSAPLPTPAPVRMEPMPRWLVVVIGAVIAAIMGLLLGGALAVY